MGRTVQCPRCSAQFQMPGGVPLAAIDAEPSVPASPTTLGLLSVLGVITAIALVSSFLGTLVNEGADVHHNPRMTAAKDAGRGSRNPVMTAPADDAVRSSVSTTDLSATIQRTRELFEEMENDVSRARDESRGNQIAVKSAVTRAQDESQKRIETEFSKLQGQTIQWRFTVSEVAQVDIREQGRIYFKEAARTTAFSGNRLYIYFDTWDPGYLLVGKNVPLPFAETLRTGDQLLITGRAQVSVGTRVGPFSNSWVNDYVVVAIKLSGIEVRAAQIEQERQRQTEEERVAELTRRRTASRDAVVQDVRNFLARGSVFNATYFSLWAYQHKDSNLPFQITITDDLTVKENTNGRDPLDQRFEVPAHFKWLGDTETLSSSSWGGEIKEHDGMFVGEVNCDNTTGRKPGWRVTMKYCVRDKSQGGYWDGREGGSTWNGTQFEGNSKSAIKLLKGNRQQISIEPPMPGKLSASNGLIAFVSDRDGNREIYAMNPDGSGQHNLTNNVANDWAPLWSPDGGRILFRSQRGKWGEFLVMDSDGGNVKQLVDQDNLKGDAPSWSPDGRRIAISAREGSGRTQDLLNRRSNLEADWLALCEGSSLPCMVSRWDKDCFCRT